MSTALQRSEIKRCLTDWLTQWQGHLLSCPGQLQTVIPKQNLFHLLQTQDRTKWGSPKRMSERDHSLKLPAPGEFLQSSNIGTDDHNSTACYRSLIGSSSSTFSGCCGRGQVLIKSQRKRREENENWREPKNSRNWMWKLLPRTRSRLRLLWWARTNPD